MEWQKYRNSSESFSGTFFTSIVIHQYRKERDSQAQNYCQWRGVKEPYFFLKPRRIRDARRARPTFHCNDSKSILLVSLLPAYLVRAFNPAVIRKQRQTKASKSQYWENLFSVHLERRRSLTRECCTDSVCRLAYINLASLSNYHPEEKETRQTFFSPPSALTLRAAAAAWRWKSRRGKNTGRISSSHFVIIDYVKANQTLSAV